MRQIESELKGLITFGLRNARAAWDSDRHRYTYLTPKLGRLPTTEALNKQDSQTWRIR